VRSLNARASELNKNGGLRRRSFADKKMLVPEIRFKKSTKCQRA
jgi:hypothetical protein